MTVYRTTFAEIDCTALLQNFAVLHSHLAKGELMPVVKANAYGHDVLQVVETLDDCAAQYAVAIIEEGIALRQAGVTQPIVVLEGAFSPSGFDACFAHQLTPVLHCFEQLDLYQQLTSDKRPYCWLKIDIGMHRLGFSSSEAQSAWDKIVALHPGKPVLCGHFSDADDADCPVTPAQLDQFTQWQKQFQCTASLANSPAIIHWPNSHVEWNRAGIALYGIAPNIAAPKPAGLTPVMTLSAPIIAIRDIAPGKSVGYGGTWQSQQSSRIATIAIGYADGYPRHAPNGTPVLINGQICPLAGRVSMDMITVDVTALNNVNVGEQVELWGKGLAVETIAQHCGTIGYELVTRIGERVPRVPV